MLNSFKERYFTNIPGELSGGLTAAIVALPLALAFGVASGLGAAAGIYGAIACGLFASLFGGTRAQVSGPTGPMTVVVATIVAGASGRPELVFAAVIVGGILQILFGYLNLGRLVRRYTPYPVVSGFMTGIGVIIVLIQVLPLFGLPGGGDVVEAISRFGTVITEMNLAALAIGASTLALIYLLPRLHKKIPAVLVALVVATGLSLVFGLDIPRIGDIPSGLPSFVIPSVTWADWQVILTGGFYLAILGSIDSLLTSVVVDKILHTRHDSKQELIGQGLGNIVSGVIGGLPGAGATMRSVINVESGGRSHLSGIFHGLVLLAVLLGLGSLAAVVPLTCLAAILITVGVGIVDYRGLKSIGSAPWSDVIVMLAVLTLTVFVDLIIAVGVGVVAACVLFVYKLGEARFANHGRLEDLAETHGDHWTIDDEDGSVTYVYHLNTPLIFSEAENFHEVMADIDQIDGVKRVLLSLQNSPVIDQSGAYALEEVHRQLKAKGIALEIAGLNDANHTLLEKVGVKQGLLLRVPQYT